MCIHTESILLIFIALIDLFSQVMKLPPVLQLAGVLLTAKFAFAPIDGVSVLKLMEKGLPKEHLALISVCMTPVSLVLPMVVARFVRLSTFTSS
jgi:PAT family acetyl-CoA transporter-like MFS transporter 1